MWELMMEMKARLPTTEINFESVSQTANVKVVKASSIRIKTIKSRAE